MNKIFSFFFAVMFCLQGYAQTENTGIETVFVKGGSFTMGCTGEQDDCSDNEKPTHTVTVSDFYIGKYEVTQAQWTAVMANNPSQFKGDSLPVENGSWNDVQEFIRKLNAQTGKSYRLPTEAEWEYAARGGEQGANSKYSGSDNVDEVAWYGNNSGQKTHAVGAKQANKLGIYDMSGNVYEWCSDWYGNYATRVIRGGSWLSVTQSVRVPFRLHYTPDYRYINLGFRLVHSSK
ncbi:MAG: formylglycine-generating enzyme family protein [Prevotellaceae bacterium]|jgi:formylglycine-generating enzyme required for sulfatase activity|nr:formylglycine-generating enzyme family protein [Prevotellaceae bacterium]